MLLRELRDKGRKTSLNILFISAIRQHFLRDKNNSFIILFDEESPGPNQGFAQNTEETVNVSQGAGNSNHMVTGNHATLWFRTAKCGDINHPLSYELGSE